MNPFQANGGVNPFLGILQGAFGADQFFTDQRRNRLALDTTALNNQLQELRLDSARTLLPIQTQTAIDVAAANNRIRPFATEAAIATGQQRATLAPLQTAAAQRRNTLGVLQDTLATNYLLETGSVIDAIRSGQPLDLRALAPTAFGASATGAIDASVRARLNPQQRTRANSFNFNAVPSALRLPTTAQPSTALPTAPVPQLPAVSTPTANEVGAVPDPAFIDTAPSASTVVDIAQRNFTGSPRQQSRQVGRFNNEARAVLEDNPTLQTYLDTNNQVAFGPANAAQFADIVETLDPSAFRAIINSNPEGFARIYNALSTQGLGDIEARIYEHLQRAL